MKAKDGNLYQVLNQTGDVLFQNEGTIEQDTYKTGYIDTTGTVVIKPIYLMATPFKADGTAIVSKTTNEFTVIDKSAVAIKEIELSSEYTGLYDIAAYTAGFQEFSIPYEDLMPIIDVDSALWKHFEH